MRRLTLLLLLLCLAPVGVNELLQSWEKEPDDASLDPSKRILLCPPTTMNLILGDVIEAGLYVQPVPEERHRGKYFVTTRPRPYRQLGQISFQPDGADFAGVVLLLPDPEIWGDGWPRRTIINDVAIIGDAKLCAEIKALWDRKGR
jgi:hypothetical protein